MEHEDNTHLDNFLQTSPHLMEHLQMASGDGVCDNVAAEEIGSNIGGKFEEHEEHNDEEEWKYIKEGQQSEKQQQRMKAGIDCKDVEGVAEVGNGHGYGYELGDVGAVDMLLLDKHEVGNGVVGISATVDSDAANAATGIEENEEVFKNDGDFSTTSNTTSTAGEDVDVDTGVLQVEMKIETAPVKQTLPQQVENLFGVGGTVGNIAEETEEDELSSLATNNTNGTNSLSENAPPHQQLQEKPIEENNLKEEFSIEDKENADPLWSNTSFDGCKEETTRRNDLDYELHSQLNPNALEFVPNFGSNPASPVAPTRDNVAFVVGEPALNSAAEIQLQPHPSTIARHLLGDDDFVAQSPLKGNGESNLDGIALPEENDFEHEAAKRPHELEQEDNLIAVGMVQHSHQQPDLLHEQLENHNNDSVHLPETDTNVADVIDHGPETSVDLDVDIGMQLMDSEKVDQQRKFSKDEPIEDVLNTVQPLPIDTESLNVSFVEESSQQELAGKELLDVEEKENISHSPSTEEMQMNLQNEIHSSAKDIPQIPIDMDNAAHMQESFYIHNTSFEPSRQFEQSFDGNVDEINVRADENLIAENQHCLRQNLASDEISFEATGAAEPSAIGTETEIGVDGAPLSLNIFAPEFTPGQKSEETKELTTKSGILDELEQKMDDLKLSTKDGIISQVEEVAQTAAHIVESLNPFAAPEPEQHETLEQSPIEADHPFSTESQLHADFLQQNEQFYNEQQEQHQTQEKAPEPACGHHEENLFSAQPENQPPASPAKLEPELNGFEKPIPSSVSTAAPAKPEPVAFSIEPVLESTSAAHPEAATAEPGSKPLSEPGHLSQPEPVLALESEPEPAKVLQVSNDIGPNVSINDEPLLVASVEPTITTAEATSEPAIDEPKQIPDETVVAVAVGAIAATAATAAASKKTDVKKPRTPTSTKSKTGDIKKAADLTKKPVAAAVKTSLSTASSARPRTAAIAADKKMTATAPAAKPSNTTATRKPLSATTATSKTVTKTITSARPTTAPAAAKPSAARTTTTTTARRSAPTSTGGSTTTSNGTTAAAKPKPASSAPTKPTTLGLSAATKLKLSSPRATLTSQLRKAAPTSTVTGLTTARSPIKTTAPTTNGVTKSSTTTTSASRVKSSTSTTITTTTTKTFTARPAPKTTHSSTITRRTVGTVSSSNTTGARTTSSTFQKKTPPGSSRPTTAGKSSLSPTKTSSAALKSKTKDVTKKPATPIKSANELKEKPTEEKPKANGTGAEDDLRSQSEQQAHLNGEGDGQQKLLENGMHHVELGNGEGSLLEQHVQALADA